MKMARTLSLRIIAERQTEEAQRDYLNRQNIHLLQAATVSESRCLRRAGHAPAGQTEGADSK